MRGITVDGIIYELQAQGGISRVYNELLPRLCDLGASVRLLTAPAQALQPVPGIDFVHAGLSVQAVPRGGRGAAGRALAGLRRQALLGTGSGQIWHSTYYTLPRLWRGPQAVTVYDMVHERFPDLFPTPAEDDFRRLKRRCVLAAEAVVCISEATRADVLRVYGLAPEKTHVVPLAHSAVFQPGSADTPAAILPGGRPFLLFVGRRSHNKNFAALLRAYSRWPGRNRVDLIAVGGEPWTGEEASFLETHGLGDQVHHRPVVDDRELCRLYQSAAAFVYPSLYEGFGIPLLEAMACGCPVVASHIPSTLEVAGDCPVYFDLSDDDSLAGALQTAWDEGRGAARCLRGERRAAQYSWQATAEKMLDVFRAL